MTYGNPELLQIDAEGFDSEILLTIDFTRRRTRFISYERMLPHDDAAACRAMMVSGGFDFLETSSASQWADV